MLTLAEALHQPDTHKHFALQIVLGPPGWHCQIHLNIHEGKLIDLLHAELLPGLMLLMSLG